MLARRHRLLTRDDFRSTMRAGRGHATPRLVVHVRTTDEDRPPRFGFITSSAVGTAVVRNRIRRRLRAIAHEVLPQLPPGTDTVVRALPPAATADWTTLREEVLGVMSRSASGR